VSQEDVDLFWRGMNSFNERDFDEFLRMFDEEIEFFPLRSAIEGPYSGHAGMRKWWADTAENWEVFQIDADELRDLDDGRLVAAGVIHAKGKGGGVPLEIPTSWLLELRNGRVTRVKFFFDREEAFRRVGLQR
jgi:ketosteroid isomerase-like protein